MHYAAHDCPGRIFIAYHDGLHVVGCSALPRHPIPHTAYHGDRLHKWANP